MRKVLIVDDDTIVRVTLRSLLPWETFGLEIAGDCSSGAAALAYMREHPVDLLISDVKMPEMSGIELLRRLSAEGRVPVALMLSGYNEFDLVREAFRLGAYDYVLKADLSAELLEKQIRSIAEKYWGGLALCKKEAAEPKSAGFALPKSGIYGAAVMEIDDFHRQTARFGENLKELLEKPMLELANQIPRVSRRGQLIAVQPGHYIFLYPAAEPYLYRREITALVRQVQSVWRDYMNLSVSAAICDPQDAKNLGESLERAENLLLLAPLGGHASLTVQWEHERLLLGMEPAKETYERLLSALYEINEVVFTEEKQRLFEALGQMEKQEAIDETLRLIALLALKFREYGEDFFEVFPDEINYYQKLERLPGLRELELWLNNYFRWELEYLKNRLSGRQNDTVLRAKRFIADNYANPELTLGSVADYIGLNEKYFTTRFTKEAGCTFSDYLTSVRLERARRLIETTNLKMYEISDRIGYNNVEHFNRMFKKHFAISPSDYRKQKKKS